MWKPFACLLAFLMLGCGGPSADGFQGTDVTGSDIGQSFAGLTDSGGKERSLAEFRGKAVIVFFGYTACPDACPTTLGRLAEVMRLLGPDAARVQVILISVDPENDTPERLGQYVTAFNPSFIGLSGSLPATEAVAREFKVFFSKSAHGHHGGGREIDHTTGAYVFDPAGRVRLFLKDDASVAAVSSDLRKLLAM